MYHCVICGNWFDNDYVVCHTVDGREGFHCQYCEDEKEDSMSRHTPGPWKDSQLTGTQHEIYTEVGDDKFRIADLVFHRPDDEVDANARLITASPDLLDALNNLMWAIGSSFGADMRHHDSIKTARLALNKAEGKS